MQAPGESGTTTKPGRTGIQETNGGDDGTSSADDRSPEHRRDGVLEALVDSGYGPGKVLSTGRGTTTIVAVMSIDQIASHKGAALSDVGVHIPAATLLNKPENLQAYLQILDLEGRTLSFGRSRRLGSVDQYLALLGEEGISSAPGPTPHQPIATSTTSTGGPREV